MRWTCDVFGHQRDPHRAWHDGLDWRSTCKRCGKPMLKDSISGKWRLFDSAADGETDRHGPHDGIA